MQSGQSRAPEVTSCLAGRSFLVILRACLAGRGGRPDLAALCCCPRCCVSAVASSCVSSGVPLQHANFVVHTVKGELPLRCYTTEAGNGLQYGMQCTVPQAGLS